MSPGCCHRFALAVSAWWVFPWDSPLPPCTTSRPFAKQKLPFCRRGSTVLPHLVHRRGTTQATVGGEISDAAFKLLLSWHGSWAAGLDKGAKTENYHARNYATQWRPSPALSRFPFSWETGCAGPSGFPDGTAGRERQVCFEAGSPERWSVISTKYHNFPPFLPCAPSFMPGALAQLRICISTMG